MDKSKYLHLISEPSINDTSKFRPVDTQRPKTRGGPVKHLLLQHEKQISAVIPKAPSKSIADSIRPNGSRLTHLCGLLKTHKEQFAVRPILSSMHTYNYALAKWLDEKMKTLSCNHYTHHPSYHTI